MSATRSLRRDAVRRHRSACWLENGGRHREVHQQDLEVVAVAERLEGVGRAVRVDAAIAQVRGFAEHNNAQSGLGRRLGRGDA